MKTLIIKGTFLKGVELKTFEKLMQGWVVKVPIKLSWFKWKVVLEKETVKDQVEDAKKDIAEIPGIHRY